MKVACVVATVLLVLLAATGSRAFFGHPNLRKFNAVPPNIAAALDTLSDAGTSVHLSLDAARAASPDELAAMREASRVRMPELVKHGGAGDGASPFAYSGYLLADPTYGSNMFYWFFEAENGDPNAPVLLWLQGGPGASSMFGLFAEVGPYFLTDDLQIVPRNVTWNSEYALLFIDNPVGVGFSYTGSDAGYSRDETSVANNLYTALRAFFTVYSSYGQNPFYLTGESYAGKYIPATAYRIHQGNEEFINDPSCQINLTGMAIGDGWTVPEIMLLKYAGLAYNMGLADPQERKIMAQMGRDTVAAITAQNWPLASQRFMNYIDGPPDYIQNITGCSNYYDTRTCVEPSYGGNIDAYLNQSSIRAQLHVGNHYYDINSGYAGFLLTDDLCKSMAPVLPTLFSSYKVLFYNGQFDFIVGPALTEAFLKVIPWPGLAGFNASPKVQWLVNPDDVDVAGYARQYQNLQQVMVRGAGHILPFDQPERALDMITRFIEGIPFGP